MATIIAEETTVTLNGVEFTEVPNEPFGVTLHHTHSDLRLQTWMKKDLSEVAEYVKRNDVVAVENVSRGDSEPWTVVHPSPNTDRTGVPHLDGFQIDGLDKAPVKFWLSPGAINREPTNFTRQTDIIQSLNELQDHINLDEVQGGYPTFVAALRDLKEMFESTDIVYVPNRLVNIRENLLADKRRFDGALKATNILAPQGGILEKIVNFPGSILFGMESPEDKSNRMTETRDTILMQLNELATALVQAVLPQSYRHDWRGSKSSAVLAYSDVSREGEGSYHFGPPNIDEEESAASVTGHTDPILSAHISQDRESRFYISA